MKKNLSKRPNKTSSNDSNSKKSLPADSSSFIFKLFSDLEEMDLDRANKVNIRIVYIRIIILFI